MATTNLGEATFNCPSCSLPLLVGPEHTGQTVACPRCGKQFVVPPIAISSVPIPVAVPPPVQVSSSLPFVSVSESTNRIAYRKQSSSISASVVVLVLLCLSVSAAAIYLIATRGFGQPLAVGTETKTTPAATDSIINPAAEEPDRDQTGMEPKTTVISSQQPQVKEQAKADSVSKPPRSLEALHQLNDGPPDFTHEEWVEIKRRLYREGLLGLKVTEGGIHEYRNDPRKYLGPIRATRQFVEGK